MLLTAVPFFVVGATWRLPDTYHSAGSGRGTATLKFYDDRDILLGAWSSGCPVDRTNLGGHSGLLPRSTDSGPGAGQGPTWRRGLLRVPARTWCHRVSTRTPRGGTDGRGH